MANKVPEKQMPPTESDAVRQKKQLAASETGGYKSKPSKGSTPA